MEHEKSISLHTIKPWQLCIDPSTHRRIRCNQGIPKGKAWLYSFGMEVQCGRGSVHEQQHCKQSHQRTKHT